MLTTDEQGWTWVVLGLGISYATQVLFVLSELLSQFLGLNNHLLMAVVTFILPAIILRCVSGTPFFKNKWTMWGNLLIIFGLLGLVLVVDISQTLAVNLLAIAFSEELFYRGALEATFEKGLPLIVAIVIQTLCFTFINHSGSSMLDNVTYRLSMACLFSLVGRFCGIGASTALHTLWNYFAIF